MKQFIENGSKVLVVGGGRSGLSASHLALDLGATVSVVDDNPNAFSSPEWSLLEQRGAHFLRDRSIGPWILDYPCSVLMSPGVPPERWSGEVVAPAYPHVRGELEWAASLFPFPMIAIAGTNGKSTTTALIGHLFRAMGYAPFIGGNFGIPLSEGVRAIREAQRSGRESPYNVGVIEVSSFQTESMQAFSPELYLLLNITPDHLDRYGQFDRYREAKLRAISLLKPDSTVLWNGDQKDFIEGRSRGPAQAAYVTRRPKDPLFGNASVVRIFSDHLEISKLPGLPEPMHLSMEKYRLSGGGNAENLAFSVLAVLLFFLTRGTRPEATVRLEEALGDFRGLPHRMEPVGRVKGVTFVNDSKATNVGAVEAALAGLPESNLPRIVLILGGRDKGGSYLPLVPGITRHVKRVVVLGEAQEKIRQELAPYVPVTTASEFSEAVRQAFTLAQEGDTVLLSPACSSYDMFHGYEERGDRFREAVRHLETAYGDERSDHGARH